MRPVPRPHHLVAVLILLAVAGAYAYLAWLDTQFSDLQIESATVMRKLHDPSLYGADPVFGPGGLWRLEAGAFEHATATLHTLQPDRSLWPVRAMAGLLSAIYLLSMYPLLYRQTHSWSVSVVVAVLSSVVIQGPGGSFWGTGPLWTVSPIGLAVALTPLAAWALTSLAGWRAAIAAGGVVLVVAQIHLGWAANLALVLGVVCLLDRRPGRGVGGAVVLLAALAAGGALTLWLRGLGRVAHLGPGELSMSQVRSAFELAAPDLLYPALLYSLASWAIVLGAMLVPSVLILLRNARFRARDVWFWLAMGAAALVVGLGLGTAAQLLGAGLYRAWYVGFPMALAITVLPAWVLLGQALTVIFRLFRPHRRLVGWLVAAVAVLWILPSDNVRVLRHQAYALASRLMAPEDRPRRLTQLDDRRQRDAELDRIALWARSHTDANAVFIGDQPILRLRSGRALTACASDLLLVFYLNPDQLPDWTARLERTGALVHSRADQADTAAISALAKDLSAKPPFNRATQWLVVLPASLETSQSGALEPVEDAAWGAYYRLYRVPLAAPAGRAPLTAPGDGD